MPSTSFRRHFKESVWGPNYFILFLRNSPDNEDKNDHSTILLFWIGQSWGSIDFTSYQFQEFQKSLIQLLDYPIQKKKKNGKKKKKNKGGKIKKLIWFGNFFVQVWFADPTDRLIIEAKCYLTVLRIRERYRSLYFYFKFSTLPISTGFRYRDDSSQLIQHIFIVNSPRTSVKFNRRSIRWPMFDTF